MAYPKPGEIVCAQTESGFFYYFLVLSKSVFFGCQWSYVFHLVSDVQKESKEVLDTFDRGFYALINFDQNQNRLLLTKIGYIDGYQTYDFDTPIKARIDEHGGGH